MPIPFQTQKNPGAPKPRLFTIGRLDVATTGLIIVTNDGMLPNLHNYLLIFCSSKSDGVEILVL